MRAAVSQEVPGRGGFDKGTLAMAQIGLMRAGRKPARTPDQRTGHRPLSNPPLRLPRTNPSSPVSLLALKCQSAQQASFQVTVNKTLTVKRRSPSGHT